MSNATLFQAFKKTFKEPPVPVPPPNLDQSFLSLDPNSNTEKFLEISQKPAFSFLATVQTQKKYEYNPDKYPPDVKIAQEHALARRVSIPSYLYDQLINKCPSPTKQGKSKEPIELCDCCGCPIKNQQLALCCDRFDLFFLGSGFPLFFDFMIWGLGLMLMIFLISSIFGLASNSKVLDMKGKEVSWFVDLSLANNGDIDISIWKSAQMIVNFCTIILILIYLQFFRRSQRKTAFECDFKSLTPSDYTLKVSGLPLNFLDYELKEHFQKMSEGVLKLNVVKINKTYAIGSYIKLLSEKNSVSLSKRDIEETLNKLKEDTTPIKEKEIEKLTNIIKQKEEQLKNLNDKVKEEKINLMKSYIKFTGTAYVTFETPEQAQFAKRKLKKTFKQRMNIFFHKGFQFDLNHFYLGKTLIYAERAPEPNDIIWENLGTSWIEKFKMQWWTHFYTLLVLVLCFFCIFGLTFLQKYLTDPNEPKVYNKYVKNLINALGAVFISVVNYLLNFVIKKFASLEKHLTVTGYDSSIASKKIIAQFLNTAIIYIIISWIKDNWIEQSGLIDQLLNICISTIIVNSALYAFDPFYLIRLLNRRKVIKNPEKSMLTQSEAHALFEEPTLDIPNLYSGVINVMLFSAFYATLEPLVVLFGLITLSIYYWIFKILLIRRSSIPVELGKKIAYDMIEYVEYVPFAFALGDVLFNIKFYHIANPWSITALCLCCINFIVPMSILNKWLFSLNEKHKLKQESPDFTTDFFTARTNFTFEYDRLNPVTQQKAVEEWVNFVENKEPSKDEKQVAVKLLATLTKNSKDLEEENKEENNSIIEAKKHEVIQVLERTKTEDDNSGLENYFMFNKQGIKKNIIDSGDTKNAAIAKMYLGQNKPSNLFLMKKK